MAGSNPENESQLSEIASIDLHKANKFLKKLSVFPFVTLVFEQDEVHIFAKGVSADSLRNIESLVDLMNSEEQDG